MWKQMTQRSKHIESTCAPWRTRISVPLLSIEIKAASSTSVSCAKRSFRGFENIALSSYKNHHELSRSLEKKGKEEKWSLVWTLEWQTSSMGTLIKSLSDYQFLKLSKTYLKILFTTINSNFIRMKWLILLDIHPSNSSKASNEIYIAVMIDKASKFFELYIANCSLRKNLQWELAFCFLLSNKPFTESGRWIFSNSKLKHGRYVGHVVFN